MNNDTRHPTRRAALGWLALASQIPLACSSPKLAWRNALAAKNSVFGNQELLTRHEVAKYPSASIGISSGGGQALLLLQAVDGPDLLWRSAGNQVIVTRHGRLVITQGFRFNLIQTELLTDDPLMHDLLSAHHAICDRSIELDGDCAGTFVAKSEFRIGRPATLNILGASIATVRVSERVRVSALEWTHENAYWLDAEDGTVWRTKQHFHPDAAPLTITTLRPVQA